MGVDTLKADVDSPLARPQEDISFAKLEEEFSCGIVYYRKNLVNKGRTTYSNPYQYKPHI